MRAERLTATLCLLAIATYPLSTLAAPHAATHAAAAAADLRWERLAWLWLIFATLTAARHRRLLLHACAVAGLLDAAAAELSPLGKAAPALWGAPTHIVAAGACAAAASLSTGTNRGWPIKAAAPALLALGLMWNAEQTAGSVSWAWDLIEAGPLCFLAAQLHLAHRWGRRAGLLLAPLYLGFLQASRAALLATAHHLQPPQCAHRSLWRGEGALQPARACAGVLLMPAAAAAAAGTAGFCASLSMLPRFQARRPHLPAPRAPHWAAAAATAPALAIAWAAAQAIAEYQILGWLSCGWLGLTKRHRGSASDVCFLTLVCY